jgi:predicted metal-dependent peptidase
MSPAITPVKPKRKKADPNNEALRVEKSVVKTVLDHPFFAALALKMRVKQDFAVPTFCVDGVHMRYNPDFCSTLDDMEVLTVLAHEVLHLAFGHLWRKGNRDMRKWNRACDYVINNYLMKYNDDEVAAGRVAPFKLPEGGLLDSKYDNMAEEEIYNLLPDDPDGGDGSGGGGEGEDGGGMGDFTDPVDDEGNTEEDWRQRAVEGVNASKLRGRESGSMTRAIERHLKGQQDWREILRELLSAPAADDYDETRPDRRFMEEDIFLPTLYSERVGTFVVAVDTSGSVTEDMLSKFMAEVQYCLDTVKPEKVIVIDCDAAINQEREFAYGDNVRDFTSKGGGGTDFRPVFDRVKSLPDSPEAVVYFTDGYGAFPDDAPGYPVVWVDYGGTQYPFGEVVRVNSADS